MYDSEINLSFLRQKTTLEVISTNKSDFVIFNLKTA